MGQSLYRILPSHNTWDTWKNRYLDGNYDSDPESEDDSVSDCHAKLVQNVITAIISTMTPYMLYNKLHN